MLSVNICPEYNFAQAYQSAAVVVRIATQIDVNRCYLIRVINTDVVQPAS